jgi:hypothetical protein
MAAEEVANDDLSPVGANAQAEGSDSRDCGEEQSRAAYDHRVEG